MHKCEHASVIDGGDTRRVAVVLVVIVVEDVVEVVVEVVVVVVVVASRVENIMRIIGKCVKYSVHITNLYCKHFVPRQAVLVLHTVSVCHLEFHRFLWPWMDSDANLASNWEKKPL